MITPAPAPKRRMLFDGVFLPPPPPAEWLEGAIMFPVSRAKKQKKKRQSDDDDLERPPKKKQRTSGARVESPVVLDQDEDYVNTSDAEDDEPLPLPVKMNKSLTKPRPRKRKTSEKVVDTTMKTPDELRKAERVAQERDHMPHLRALAKDWDKNKEKKEEAVCPRVWLEREGLLVEQAREGGRWVVDERVDADEYEERARKERVEMVRSGRRWYVGLPPPPVRPVLGIPSAPSTIDGDDDGCEGEGGSLFDGPYTPDAPAPAPAPEERDSLFDGSCTPLTPSEQEKGASSVLRPSSLLLLKVYLADLALGLDEDNDKDSLFDGPFTWDDLDSPEDALRVETELALVLGDDDAEASTDPDYVDADVRSAIIGTRQEDESPVKTTEELTGLLGDMSDLSTPTPSLGFASASASNSTLHDTTNSTLKASFSACTVVTVSSSATATQPAQDDDDVPDEHPDYDCSHLRRPFVSCNPPRIIGLPLRWVPAPAPASASAQALEQMTKRKRKAEKQHKRSRARAYEEEDEEDEESDSEALSLYTDGSSDDGAEAYSVPRRRRGNARTRKHEDSSSPSSRSPKTPHPHPNLVDPYYYTDTSSYPPDPTPTEPVFVPDEVVDESMRGSKADDVFLLPAPGPVEFGWDDGDEEEGRMVIDVEAVADAWKSLGAIGIGL
ncbi:hypothetical protein EXIGLDRAFT_705031 [Exidia glandulosa HHB12029]|uniref:Uncharacterized protein n=1 Tax=Exidia glandulosa HHB12029 TaxID=1314781 RepID=A0A165BG11_EXIGL|nr:hypothetical protein EXIGLDRAFT_705031 [Exidia glandulosa HHB12029]